MKRSMFTEQQIVFCIDAGADWGFGLLSAVRPEIVWELRIT